MLNTWALCALGVRLALVATSLAVWFRISKIWTALCVLAAGTLAKTDRTV
jgi:hypothetical protein